MSYETAAASKIRIPKTAEVVAARIRKAIVRGDLKPGTTLSSESELIADFQVSRPSIREAIRILEAEGLISVSRGARKGPRVNAPSAGFVTHAAGLALQTRDATISEVYEARMLIEAPAARLAAERRPKEVAAVLRTQLEREESLVDDVPAVTRAIADFHELLLDKCGNVTLAVIGLGLRGVLEKHLLASQDARKPMTEAARKKQLRFGLSSHRKLIELIERGDGKAAEAHWISHMKAAGEFWLSELGSSSVIDILD